MDIMLIIRVDRPELSNHKLGEIVEVRDVDANFDNIVVGGYLGLIKVTNVPDNKLTAQLHEEIGKKIDLVADPNDPDKWDIPATDPADGRPIENEVQYIALRRGRIEPGSLPTPYQAEFDQYKKVTIPFGLMVAKIFNRGLGRYMNQGDF